MKPKPPAVVAGVLVRDGRALLCHRSRERSWSPDTWDLPGGHIEGSETAEFALVRELQEEIGIEVPVPTSFPFTRIQDETLDLAVYVVKSWAGQAKNLSPEEHDRVEWFAADDLAGLRLAHPSYLVLLSAVLRDAPDPGHEVER